MTADQAMTASGDALAASQEKTQTVVTNTAQRLTASTSSIERLQRTLDTGYASSQRFAQGQALIQSAIERNVISTQRGAELTGLLQQRYQAMPVAANAVVVATDGITRSLSFNRIGMLELQAAGINTFQALAAGMAPFRVATMESAQVVGALIQGTEGLGSRLLSAVVSPIGLAVTALTALTAGFATLLLHAHSVDESIRQFNLTLRDFGKTGLATGADLQADIRQFQALGVSASDAETAIARLARTPGINPSWLGQIGVTGADIGAVLGTSTTAGITTLTAALTGGVAAMLKLGAATHSITPGQEVEILMLDRTQGATAATNRAFQDIEKNLAGDFKTHTGAAAGAINSIGTAWSNMLDKLSQTSAIKGAQSAIIAMLQGIAAAANAPAATPEEIRAAAASVNTGYGAGLSAASLYPGFVGTGVPVATAALPPAGMNYGGGMSALISAMVQAESGGNPNAVSPAGAMGLMQLMPGTAASLGLSNPFDPMANVAAGSQYISQLVKQFGSLRLGLDAYNWGPGNVSQYLAGAKYLPTSVSNYASGILGASGLPGSTTAAQLTGPATQSTATADAIAKANDAIDVQRAALQKNIPIWQQYGVVEQAAAARQSVLNESVAKYGDDANRTAAANLAYKTSITQATIELQKQNDTQSLATQWLSKIADAFGVSAAAGADMALRAKADEDAFAKFGDTTGRTTQALRNYNEAQAEAAQQQRIANNQFIQSQQDQQAQLQLQIATEGQSTDQVTRQIYLLQQEQEIRARFPTLSGKDLQNRLDSVNATADLVQQETLAQQAQQRIDSAFRSIGQTVESTLTQSLANAFDPTQVTNWSQTVHQLLGSIISQIADMAFIKPAIGSVLSMLPGVGGNVVNQFGSLFGGSSGGGAVVTAPDGSIIGTVSNGASLANSFSGGGGLFGGSSWLNSLGVQLGFSPGPAVANAATGDFAGGADAGGIFGSTTLGQFAGAAGAGFGAGDLLRSLPEATK